MSATLEERVATLEAEVARLKSNENISHAEKNPETPWWEKVRGVFKDDPIYDEAMALGKAYRESLRPPDDEDEQPRLPTTRFC